MAEGMDDLASTLRSSLARYRQKRFVFPARKCELSYAEMLAHADIVARGLRQRGIQPGRAVGLLFSTQPEFIASFVGVLAAGAIAVPLPHPSGLQTLGPYVERLLRIIRNSSMPLVIASEEFRDQVLSVLTSDAPRTLRVALTSDIAAEGAHAAPVEGAPSDSDLALVQYTSGSTSEPRGVALTHGNVLAGIRAIIHGIQLSEADVNGQWLPLHHDMGLIGMLSGIVAGTDQYLWSPEVFVRRPAKWLGEFARCGATIYAGPNFSYHTLLQKVPPALIADLDLSRWRVAFNGAEVIDPNVMREFCGRFAAAGFRPSTMFPVYGLAEATLAASFPDLSSERMITSVDRELLTDQAIVTAPRSPTGARSIVAVGRPVLGHALRIVDADRRALPDGRAGQIEVRGPAVMKHYFGLTPQESGVDAEGWARTGDLGFIHEGQLHVTGRSKELIIVRGAKYHPFDVEAAARSVQGIYRQDHVVAFAHDDAAGERVVLMAETDGKNIDVRQFRDDLRSAVLTELGLSAVEVVAVKPRTLARTTSGKFQRLLMRERYRSGLLKDACWTPGEST